MPSQIGSITNFSGGIADSAKMGSDNQCAFSRSIEYRRDAKKIKLLPKTVKETGELITDLPVWAERVIVTGDTYTYGNTGNIYKRDTNKAWTLAHTAPQSHGNGMSYFGEDGYLYYSQDKTIGRYGRFGSNPQWYDNFLASEGGVPTNQYSLKLTAASSQYATAADSASLSVTGPLTLEAYIKPASLPSVNNTMTLCGKWDASGATRSYLMDIKGISNFFLDGSDGALTIAADTTEAPIDSACSGTSGTYILTATNVSFAAGQAIMIHQTQGTGAGTVQHTTISSYTAGTITTADLLNYSYSTGAQVRVMKRYTNVTINSGKTYTAKAWNGTTGGILAFYANGTVTVTGSISARGKGFRGGNGDYNPGLSYAYQGEGSIAVGTKTYVANTIGGGGGGSGTNGGAPGGGGSHATSGTNGYISPQWDGRTGNAVNRGQGATTAVGTTDLTTISFGGGGGGGGCDDSQGATFATLNRGGAGGGILAIFANVLTNNGTIISDGEGGFSDGYEAQNFHGASGAGGAGGSIILKSNVATLGTGTVTSNGGGGSYDYYGSAGAGGSGRIHLSYATSYTGTTTPTIDAGPDSSINTSNGHQLRLGISSNGSLEDFITQDITGNITVGEWHRFSITWDSTTAYTTFYKDGVLLNHKYGVATSISDNASLFSVGSNKNATVYSNFFNGQIDSIRVWAVERLASQIINFTDQVLAGTETNLQAYYTFENAYTDGTSNANTLTAVNAPTFVINDVPFSGITTRQDQDASLSATGNTYTVPVAISEAATARQTFIANKDPQKSVRVYISAKGTGNWTLTVHDPQNRVVSSLTVPNAQLNVGFFEFVFASIWRPVVGATYHFHVTSTVADGSIRTSGAGDMETADFTTFFQFLVDDAYHPMAQIVNVLAIGNERYVATYDGLTYDPMALILPPGFRVRCLTYWREYLVIGTWKGSNVKDYDEGKVFFWDGISVTYNSFMDVPEGAINAMQGTRDSLYIIAGYSMDLLLYNGYLGSGQAQKIKRLPDFDNATYVEVFPGAFCMWRALLHIGISGNSDSTTIERGAYTWGTLNKSYPESLNYDYPISTGSRASMNVKIGMCKSVGSELLIGWQDGTAFGVDVVDSAGDCATSGTYEALIEDAGKMSNAKLPLIAKADFEPLIAGQSVSIKYKVDRGDSFRIATEDTVGATNVRLICRDRVRELQAAVDLNSTSGISPEVLGISLEVDLLPNEKQI